MANSRSHFLAGLAAIALCGGIHAQDRASGDAPGTVTQVPVGTLAVAATVSERFLSYNVEMLELTGGRFWKPYASTSGAKGDLYEQRPPIDLEHPRLRMLAKALGPAYVRYSGTWANATVLADADAPSGPVPKGYDGVLTREQWRKAVAFAKASDAKIVTSMPTSTGSHDANGVWMPDAADRLLSYTDSLGGEIAATEFANEPNLIGGTKPPAGYTAADYRRDFTLFHDWLRRRSPDTLIVGPGAFELGRGSRFPSFIKTVPAADVATGGAHRPDVVSFHFYGALSQRCNGAKDRDTYAPGWLASIDTAIADTVALRDRISPKAPVWLTETAETACGGNPEAGTFADTFRFVDQLARSARQGVQVVMHNTLAASDYALLDEHDFAPRPSFWAAYLWRRTMGMTVLDSGPLVREAGLHLYAHCQRGVPGGVTLLAINPDRTQGHAVAVPGRAEVFSLTGKDDASAEVMLNGRALKLDANDALPRMEGQGRKGSVSLPALSVTFINIPGAGNASCR